MAPAWLSAALEPVRAAHLANPNPNPDLDSNFNPYPNPIPTPTPSPHQVRAAYFPELSLWQPLLADFGAP